MKAHPIYKSRKANSVGHILCKSYLLKHIIEGKNKDRVDEEEDASSYWMTLRKTRYWNLKKEALDRTEPIVEETTDPSQNKL